MSSLRVKTSIALTAGGFIAIFLMILPQEVASIVYGQLPSWWWDKVNSQFGRIYGVIAIVTVIGMSHLIYRVAKKITPWVSRQLEPSEQT